MFSASMKGIIAQEMANEREKLEKNIAAMKQILYKASSAQCELFKKDPWAKAYKHWDCYEDTDELEEKINAAKKDLAKLDDKIKNHGSDSSSKQCGHRHNCSCSGDKRAEREVVAMRTSERLDKMALFKEEANALYAHKKYRNALALYEKSLIYFEYCFDGTDVEREIADALQLQCLLNCAACFLQLKLYPKVIEYCNEALEVDGRSAKAWFRRAKAHRLQDKLEVAEKDLKKAIEASGEGCADGIKREMRLLKEAKKRSKHSAIELATAIMGGRK